MEDSHLEGAKGQADYPAPLQGMSMITQISSIVCHHERGTANIPYPYNLKFDEVLILRQFEAVVLLKTNSILGTLSLPLPHLVTLSPIQDRIRNDLNTAV